MNEKFRWKYLLGELKLIKDKKIRDMLIANKKMVITLHNKQLERAVQLKSQEIIKDVQEYLDEIDGFIVPLCYSHGIKLDRFAKKWEKIKKKHLEELE